MRVLETEVLIIGGGLAGLRAAIAAARNGVSTILASKSAIGAGCNSILAGGGFAMAVSGFTAEDHARVTLDAGQHVNDRKLVQKLVQDGAKEADFLKEIGVGLSPQAFGCRVDIETNAGGRINGGNILMKKIAQAARRYEHIRLIPYFFVYRILLSGDTVSGAIGFEKDGTPCLISCKAIILATGGGAGIYAQNDNSKGIVGDGYALALEAGLSLVDMEFVQFYPLGFAERGLPSTIIFPPIPAEAWMHDAEGNDLLKKHRIEMNLHDFVVAARDRASYLIYNESQQGAVFLNYTHVPDEKWAQYPLTLFPRQRFNFEAKPFQITPMAHFFMGGVKVGVSTETDVRGFFAAGEVTTGVHGANRLGGNALTECLVFGAESGVCAADYAKNARFKHATFKTDQWLGSLLEKKTHANTRAALSGIMRSVRDIAWKYAGPVRNETGMRKGLSLLEETTMAFERVAVDTTTDLISRREVANSLLLTKAILLSSLARQESIGAFQRDDYPQRSTSASFRRVFVRLDEKENELKIRESYKPLTGGLVNVIGAKRRPGVIMKTEERLAEYVFGATFADVPIDALQVVKNQLLTVLGTTIAGASAEGCEPLVDLYRELGGKEEATILIHGGKVPAQSAALVNGVMARALDFCDALAPGAHIGSSLVPAALAAAELAGGCSGIEFLTSLVIGTEVGVRLNLTESTYDGFDPTGVCVVFSSTAAAARILGLNQGETLNALALAFNRCAGSFQSNVDGSLAVRVIQGWVAETGLMCARFASLGITGPKNFLEGVYGYFHLFGRDRIDPETVVEGLGSRFELHKVLFKKYPSCGLTLGSTDVILGLAQEYGIDPAGIDRIEVTVPPYAYKLVGHPFQVGSNPKVNAQFSIAYCVANALLRKCSKLPHFEESAIKDPAVLELAKKVRVISDAALEARGHTPLDMRVVMLDGRIYERGIDIAPGFPGNPLNKEDHEQRLRDCVAFAKKPLQEQKIGEIIKSIDSLEKIEDVRNLIPLMLL